MLALFAFTSMEITLQLRLIALIAGSMLLGGIIGFERERVDKPAGIRTHMLLAGTTTALILISQVLVHQYMADDLPVNTDPVRVFEAIIAGVSFLGAGTILRRKGGDDVQGLTTAASLLFVCMIGAAVAIELWVLAIGGVVLALLVLHVVNRFF